MILRKPYAFLIKNFKKIHIVMLLLCAFIFYKHYTTNGFIREFMDIGVYNEYVEPISKYVSLPLYLAVILVVVMAVVLVILLRRKEKPWKLYSLIVIEYVFMLIVFFMVSNFFNSYTATTETAGIRAVKDLMTLSSFLQYPTFIILFMRIVGVDLNKFNFNSDAEYLELSSEDREEFEINVNIDKDSVKRTFNKFKRNLNYFYVEHKFICNTIFLIMIVVIFGYGYYYYGILHKVYKENGTFVANDYRIKVNRSYYTDTNFRGEAINKSGYIIVDLTITNLSSPGEMDMNKFHVITGTASSTYTMNYNTMFVDIGKLYTPFELKRDKPTNVLLAFKIDKSKKSDRYALYYQEINSQFNSYLRKIKLSPLDLTKTVVAANKKVGQKLVVEHVNGKKQDITVDDYEITDSTEYTHYVCPQTGCHVTTGELKAPEGSKILKIDFSSNEFDGKQLIDFSMRYGTIKYIHGEGQKEAVNFVNLAGTNFTGKELFVKVPNDIVNSSKLELEYTIRNKKYTYVLR